MKKIYISSPFRHVDDFFIFNLKKDLTDLGYEVLYPEKSEAFTEDLKVAPEYQITQSDIFIAVIKERNPYVFYELGYATALGKKVLIISDSDFDMPASLKNYNYIKFDHSSSHSIYNIINFIQNVTIENKKASIEISELKHFVSELKSNPQLVDRVSGPQFEDMVFNYFQNIGAKIQRPNQTTDYGYDFILQNHNGFNKTIVEVKKYSSNSKVSVNTIQQVVGAMNIYEADHAILITTSEFTSSAKDFATSLKRQIELWDINYLTDNL